MKQVIYRNRSLVTEVNNILYVPTTVTQLVNYNLFTYICFVIVLDGRNLSET